MLLLLYVDTHEYEYRTILLIVLYYSVTAYAMLLESMRCQVLYYLSSALYRDGTCISLGRGISTPIIGVLDVYVRVERTRTMIIVVLTLLYTSYDMFNTIINDIVPSTMM